MNIQERKTDLLNRKADLEHKNQQCQTLAQQAQQQIHNNSVELLRIEGALAMLAEMEAPAPAPEDKQATAQV